MDDQNDNVIISLRDALNLSTEDNSFDTEIKIYANNALSIVKQNGVLIKKDTIEKSTTWNDLYLTDDIIMQMFKMFIFIKVKILFDPPPASNATYINDAADESLWRLKEEVVIENRNKEVK